MTVKSDTLSTPRVNTIGSANRPRPREDMTTIWSPDGQAHEMTVSNARDKVRHDGWLVANPNAPKPKDGDDDNDGEAGLVDAGTADHVTTIELQGLRETYIKVTQTPPDMRWGRRRLQEEIDKANEAANPV